MKTSPMREAVVSPPRSPPPATPRAIVGEAAALVSPPTVYARIAELLESPGASASDFARVVETDPSLTARLLRAVNSPFYGFASRVESVTRAIALTGVRELFQLVLAVSAMRTFERIPLDLVSVDAFWRHSVFTGLMARATARRCGVLRPDRLFVAGLLHDVGELLLYRRVPAIMRDLLLVAGGDEQALFVAERETLGFTHADVGGELARLWSLPAPLAASIAGHHEPENATGAGVDTAIVHVADIVAGRSMGFSPFEGAAPPQVYFDGTALLRRHGVDVPELALGAALEEAADEFVGTMDMLIGRG